MCVLSKIEYGNIIYQAASSTTLKKLDSIHNTGIRISIGAFRTSPKESLYSATGIMSLENRRKERTIQYYAKMVTKFNHLSTNPNTSNQLNNSIPVPFQVKTSEILDELDINLENDKILPRSIMNIAPWTIQKKKIINDLMILKKVSTPEMEYMTKFKNICLKYDDYERIYTDGSKSADHCGIGIFSTMKQISVRIHIENSIYSTELYAIYTAINEIAIKSDKTKFIIFTDSKSAIESINNNYSENPIIQLIQSLLHKLRKIIIFCWVPSHIGIHGNEKADELAKHSKILAIDTTYQISIEDIKMHIKRKIKDCWNKDWSKMVNNKLRKIKPEVGKWSEIFMLEDRKSIACIFRVIIGHSNLTHCYLLNKEEEPNCEICNRPLTMEHLINFCTKYNNLRYKLNVNIFELNNELDKFRKIIRFLKENEIFNSI